MECKDGKAHRWIIATPNGPESKGRCRRCKAERMFWNSDRQDREMAWKTSQDNHTKIAEAKRGKKPTLSQGEADTPALAICIAFLKSKGVEM